MSRMSELHFDITEELVLDRLTRFEIAAKFEVPVSWVDEVAQDMAAEDEALYYAEAMGSL